jgi:hypothetical protein
LVPLPDASESCFFFPMVMRWRTAGRGGSGDVGGAANGRDDAGQLLRPCARDTMLLMAT